MRAIRRLLIAGLMLACANLGIGKASPMPKRDINAVLRDHDKELMALPNVVGVYVGVLEGTNEPCLRVMLKREPSKDDLQIPKRIEGFPVVTEITGELRPLK